ncbi:nitroreductase family protein [Acidocella aromatica]|uniref:Nitroreductase n=1 Tax=Acidocella aromatica TaxID=1303579 RepID=A0A840VBT1_9PROT|nr:nitroreductase family protein [Acidocella aromatica]MBB5373166.1 nitroreductase [Acidocella aromatica]
MELREAIYGRRSTRGYTSEPIPAPVIEGLISAAIQAPSAVNEQPWHFTIVRSQETLDRISTAAKAHMLKLMESSSFPHHLHGRLQDPGFHIFYRAPALIVISTREGDWHVENAALAAQNLMLAAHGAGLGSCWIGFAQRWLETSEGRMILGLPEHYLPVAPIIIGHAKHPVPPVPREAPWLHWLD